MPIADTTKIVAVVPASPAENIPVTESSPLETIKPLMPDNQNVFQVEPGPWAATRGGVTRTQICKSQIITTSIVIHTVTADKTFYLVSYMFNSFVDGSDNVALAVRNTGDVLQYYLLRSDALNAQPFVLAQSFPMPIAIPAGFDIYLISGRSKASACITGWEE